MEKLVKEYKVELKWVAFPLHPETPAQGLTLEELFAGRGMDVKAMVTRLKELAQGLGLPFGERDITYNSRRAQELGKWAEHAGQGEAFHLAAFKAYFAEGRNLHDTQVLGDILEDIGLSAQEGLALLEQGVFAASVDRDWAYAKRCGVTAVPTFQIEDMQEVGAKPYPTLARFVERATPA